MAQTMINKRIAALRYDYAARATVHQASAPRRAWTRLVGVSEISSLYEVGFEG